MALPPPPRPAVHVSRSLTRPPLISAAWRAVAACESGGDWADDTGNGYEGGLQFSPTSWAAMGGTRYAAHAYDATPAEQVTVARRLLRIQGVVAWPVCGPLTGLTVND